MVRAGAPRSWPKRVTWGADPVLVDGKGGMFGLEGKEMMLLRGVIFRALFHGQRPASVIRSNLENSDEMMEPDAGAVGG